LTFEQEKFNNFIKENNIYGFFNKPITLKSGRKSHFYANWRNVVEDVYLTKKLAEQVIKFSKSNNIDVDTFYGVPEGATKLGIITQFLYAKNSENFEKGSHVLAMGRAKPKDHGAAKDKFFVGVPKGKVIMIEDVTTTGMSMLKALDELQEAKINVVAVISLTNRMELRDDGTSVKHQVEKRNVKFFNMSSALQMLPIMYNKLQPGENIGQEIEKEFNEYGVDKIKLI